MSAIYHAIIPFGDSVGKARNHPQGEDWHDPQWLHLTA
jgi:hypothetical protein